jgi:hypothetical protein
MQTIEAVHTPCKNCIFAKYENITQVGCHIDYIEKYKNTGASILEAYDDEKEFYIINNKKCIGYRENSWFVHKKMGEASLEQKIAFFKEHNFLHYMAIINLDQFNDSETIAKLTKELSLLQIKPRKIIFIRYTNNKNHPYGLIQQILKEANLNCKWRIQTMLDHQKYEQTLHESINLNKKYRFILAINKPTENLNRIIDLANKTVYSDMAMFCLIKNKDQSSMIFSTVNYRHLLLIDNKDLFTSDELHTIV